MVVVATNKQTTRPLSKHFAAAATILCVIGSIWLSGLVMFLADPNESAIQVRSDGDMVEKSQCPVGEISALSWEALHPSAGSRHMIDPPQGGKLTLVCCETSKGYFSALLHHQWAPLGVARLLDMIRSGYFSTKVPLFRCTDACQFGLSGDANVTKRFNERLPDDPNWMPPGKENRKNDKGVRRFPAGFWTYAGSGPHSRSNQFVITLKPNPFMGGGSPWEVPLGELVGPGSFDTLSQFYTGYGEKGPSQKILRQEGTSARVQEEWPMMDYILECGIVDETSQ